MQLFRNGDLVTGRISKREKRGGDRRRRDAGIGYGRNFVSDRFSDRARVLFFFFFFSVLNFYSSEIRIDTHTRVNLLI